MRFGPFDRGDAYFHILDATGGTAGQAGHYLPACQSGVPLPCRLTL